MTVIRWRLHACWWARTRCSGRDLTSKMSWISRRMSSLWPRNDEAHSQSLEVEPVAFI